MMIKRLIQDRIESRLGMGRAILLSGARRVGKTTLAKMIALKRGENWDFWNCDDAFMRNKLERASAEELKSMISGKKTVVIDEAQRVKNIGLTLKILVDNHPETQLIITGSSALELTGEISEPLTGRKFEFHIYPFSLAELEAQTGRLQQEQLLEHRLIWGSYPEVVNNPGMEAEILRELTSSYLYKDILAFQEVRKPQLLDKLITALALQAGSEVNAHELAKLLGVNSQTVERYIDLLEKTYVIFRMPSLSRNERTELRKSRKIFFCDNGIRNAVISNFNPLDLRADKGALWENFLVSERMKRNSIEGWMGKTWFWRTVQQQEVDYIEEDAGKLRAWEFKWKAGKARVPLTFRRVYPEAETAFVDREHFWDFIGGKKNS